nr:2950_t:CDS:2 [Entrophospora candida]
MVSYRPNDSSDNNLNVIRPNAIYPGDGELLRTIQGSNPAGIYYNELAPILPLPIDCNSTRWSTFPTSFYNEPSSRPSSSLWTCLRTNDQANNITASSNYAGTSNHSNGISTAQSISHDNISSNSFPFQPHYGSTYSYPLSSSNSESSEADKGKVEDGEKSQKDYDPEFARILEMKLQELQKLKKHSLNANDSVTYSDATTTKNDENVNVVDNNCGSGSKDDDDERELPNKFNSDSNDVKDSEDNDNNCNNNNINIRRPVVKSEDDDVEDEEGEQRIYKKMRPINTLRLKKSILQNKNNSNKNNNNNNNKRWIRRRIIN